MKRILLPLPLGQWARFSLWRRVVVHLSRRFRGSGQGRFEATNPALKADADNVDEMRAEEITAYLRPNPQFTLSADGTQIAPHDGVWTPSRAPTNSPTSAICTSAITSGVAA